MGQERAVRYVITVLAQDRVGIIADVTDALYALSANIEAMSQTVVGRWFTMILTAAFPETVTDTQVKHEIEASGGFAALVMPSAPEQSGEHEPEGEPFVVTVVGNDRPGIVRGLTRCFAQRGVNIEDVWNEVRDGQFVVIFKVIVPSSIDAQELRYELEQVAQSIGVTVRFQHHNLFTATNALSIERPGPH